MTSDVEWMGGTTSLGQRVLLARKAQGLTQGQLAALAGIAAVSVKNYERGISDPRPFTARALAEALHVPESWLLYG